MTTRTVPVLPECKPGIIRIESLRHLDDEDRKAALELLQIACASSGKESEEAWEAFCEITSAAGNVEAEELDTTEAEDREAARRVKAYRRKVGRAIRERRVALGLTQQALAAAVGIPQRHVSRLERGKHAPTHVTITRLAKALQTAPAHLDPGCTE